MTDTLDAEPQQGTDDGRLPAGARIGAKYEIVGFLGEGGFGMVYDAVQHPIDRPVAIKVLSYADHKLRKRFLREATVCASLQHPAAVTVHDFGVTEDGAPYMVLEKLDGHDLEVEFVRAR